ncbi:hypothetical protein PR048_016508 [Dryococelus australis]|uniref:Integrase catalytic domain-containing protein n=1 Tax=Dryococelus australis TaxID=614101 RepID=A0ABQ9HKC6_9NEOP|nr:hypothetical protein PR048_016508 [Dryococelus australis]
MTQDITEFVQTYVTCKLSQGNPTQECLTVENILSRPWMYVASDLFQLKGDNFLVIENNGVPQFFSHEFEKFQWEWNFTHQIFSPHFPHSNGLAECYVKEVKNLIYKCRMDDRDTMLTLLHHRNTS